MRVLSHECLSLSGAPTCPGSGWSPLSRSFLCNLLPSSQALLPWAMVLSCSLNEQEKVRRLKNHCPQIQFLPLGSGSFRVDLSCYILSRTSLSSSSQLRKSSFWKGIRKRPWKHLVWKLFFSTQQDREEICSKDQTSPLPFPSGMLASRIPGGYREG